MAMARSSSSTRLSSSSTRVSGARGLGGVRRTRRTELAAGAERANWAAHGARAWAREREGELLQRASERASGRGPCLPASGRGLAGAPAGHGVGAEGRAREREGELLQRVSELASGSRGTGGEA